MDWAVLISISLILCHLCESCVNLKFCSFFLRLVYIRYILQPIEEKSGVDWWMVPTNPDAGPVKQGVNPCMTKIQ